MSNHPITPPDELVEQWREEWEALPRRYPETCQFRYVATQAAQWQLEDCCEQLKSIPSPLGIPLGEMASNALHNACRPKPLSLKEQALEQLDEISNCFRVSHGGPIVCDKIRKALEAL